MLQINLFAIFTNQLNELAIPYMVTGSAASIIYGDPRLTHDIDIVIELARDKIPKLLSSFPAKDFYCPPEEVVVSESIRPQRGHFNIIHHQSGFKADIYCCGTSPLQHWGLENRKLFEVDNNKIWFAPIEYVIVKKLMFYREGKSEKHLRDIKSMLKNSLAQIQKLALEKFILEYKLEDEWKLIAK